MTQVRILSASVPNFAQFHHASIGILVPHFHPQARPSTASPCPSVNVGERVKGIEPSSSAWKAIALPLSYTRNYLSPAHVLWASSRALSRTFAGQPASLRFVSSGLSLHPRHPLHPARRVPSRSVTVSGVENARAVGGAGFEPAKALPSDLQSDPFDRSGNPPEPLRLESKRSCSPSDPLDPIGGRLPGLVL